MLPECCRDAVGMLLGCCQITPCIGTIHWTVAVIAPAPPFPRDPVGPGVKAPGLQSPPRLAPGSRCSFLSPTPVTRPRGCRKAGGPFRDRASSPTTDLSRVGRDRSCFAFRPLRSIHPAHVVSGPLRRDGGNLPGVFWPIIQKRPFFIIFFGAFQGPKNFRHFAPDCFFLHSGGRTPPLRGGEGVPEPPLPPRSFNALPFIAKGSFPTSSPGRR